MLDREDIDTIGRALVEIQDTFQLPTFELVQIMQKHFIDLPEVTTFCDDTRRYINTRPWKVIIQRGREEANGEGKDSTESSTDGRVETNWANLLHRDDSGDV